MAVYADPSRCPDCRTTLPQSPTTCPACALPLTGPLVVRLFGTLQAADRLLAEVRATAAPVPAEGGAPVAEPFPPPYPAQPYPAQPYPAQPEPAPRRRGLSAPSVPVILLGLGAICLLVAAVTFLVFAWSWLGVGGRTAVLLTLTAAAATSSELLRRRGLRVAGESLALVALGLVVLDTLGADDAGWLGTLDESGLLTVVGIALATPSLVWTLFTSSGDRAGDRPLVVPQVMTVLGLACALAGWAAGSDQWYAAAAAATALFLVLVLAARSLSLPALEVLAAVTAGLWWLPLTLASLTRVMDHATVRQLVGDLEGWPLVVSTLLLVGATLLARTSSAALVVGLGSAGTLVTLAPVIVAADNQGADLASVLVVATLLWSVAVVRLPSWSGAARWATATIAPLGLVALGSVLLVGLLVAEAVQPLAELAGEPWTHAWSARVGVTPDLDPSRTPALLLGPLVAALVVATLALRLTLRGLHPAPASGAVRGGAAALVTTALVVASYESPLALALLPLVLAGLLLVGWALRRDGATDRASATEVGAGGAVLLVALGPALASEGLTLVAASLALAASVAAYLRSGREDVRTLAGLAAPALLALAGWTAAQVGGVPEVWRAAPLVLVLGLLLVRFPRPELEVTGYTSGAAVAAVSVGAAAAPEDALAAYLTLGGALVVLSSIVNADRRFLAWAGGVLLAAATWVRLFEAGVTTPEAYTMPSALALVAVGLVRLTREVAADTWSTISAGLLLATVPSLVTVMTSEPATLRALLLGLGCLALVLGGAAVRWSAPLLVGAVVGALLVLREWGPYAADVPPWVVIGLAGSLLLAVGVTWEARLHELRRGAAYLARLR